MHLVSWDIFVVKMVKDKKDEVEMGYPVNLIHITVDPFMIQTCYILVSRHRIMDVVTGHWRSEITHEIWLELSDQWLNENVSGDGEYKLHHQELFHCENGDIGKEKKVLTNKRRSKKASKKHELIKLLKEYKTDSNNEVVKETIVRLMKRHLEDL